MSFCKNPSALIFCSCGKVYEYCNAGLPNQFLAFLDATQADL